MVTTPIQQDAILVRAITPLPLRGTLYYLTYSDKVTFLASRASKVKGNHAQEL